MTEPIMIKVDELLNAVDQHGNDWTDKIPTYARRKAQAAGMALRKVIGPKAEQWRMAELAEFEELSKRALTMAPTGNVKNELQNDVEQFLKTCDGLRPETLIMSELKWRYLIRSVLRGKNIMITGPSGSGKTLAVQTVAKTFADRPFFYFNLGATQDARSTLIGNTHFDKVRGTFVTEALFIRAIQMPNAIILLDELSRAHPDAHNILMTILDPNQRYLRIDEHPDTPTIKMASGVTFIATANIGAEYTATRVLDRALQDRFTIIEMDSLKREEEKQLLTRIYPDLDPKTIAAIADIAVHTREQLRSDDPKVSTIISTRMTVEMAGLLYDGFNLAEAAEACIYPFYSDAGGVDSERTYMRQVVQKHLDMGSDPNLYNMNPEKSSDDEDF